MLLAGSRPLPPPPCAHAGGGDLTHTGRMSEPELMFTRRSRGSNWPIPLFKSSAHLSCSLNVLSYSKCFRIAVSVCLCTLYVSVSALQYIYSMFLRTTVQVHVCLRTAVPVCLRHRLSFWNCTAKSVCLSNTVFAHLFMHYCICLSA